MTLIEQTIGDFLDTLSSSSPTPGGGSVSALVGAISSALVSMVASLTVGKEKYKDSWQEMEGVLQKAKLLQGEFIYLAERDIESFDDFMVALRMPKVSDDEKEMRSKAMVAASKKATLAPLEMVELCEGVANLSLLAAKFGNKMAGTDAAIGALLANVTAKSASYNVLVNLPMIDDANFVKNARYRMTTALKNVEEISNKTVAIINEQFKEA